MCGGEGVGLEEESPAEGSSVLVYSRVERCTENLLEWLEQLTVLYENVVSDFCLTVAF